MTKHTVGSVDEVPDGGVMGVEVDGLEIAVFNCDGEFYAMQNRCIHRSAALHRIDEERIGEEDCLTEGPGDIDCEARVAACPWHGWKFDLETGQHQTTEKRMRTFPVVVDGDELRVEL
ncbi:Rieske 2Fe-2S domain-containing protein [Halobellus sp. GM3]|uniref:Rieske 2Fe-2S domain-containing protein n=1 Tax=Halobellus sp. GM3 TaxID=3458410 RepID=UPI00403DFF91